MLSVKALCFVRAGKACNYYDGVEILGKFGSCFSEFKIFLGLFVVEVVAACKFVFYACFLKAFCYCRYLSAVDERRACSLESGHNCQFADKQYFSRFERQSIVLVFKKHGTFGCDIFSNLIMFFFAVCRIGRIFCRRHSNLQNSVNRLVDCFFVERAVFDCFYDELIVHTAARRHFQVVTCFYTFYSFVGCAPVAYDDTFESPLVSQDFVEYEFVFCSVSVIDKIVGRHNSAGLRKFDGYLERQKINLSECTLVNCRIYRHTVSFLIVCAVVFD